MCKAVKVGSPSQGLPQSLSHASRASEESEAWVTSKAGAASGPIACNATSRHSGDELAPRHPIAVARKESTSLQVPGMIDEH